MMARNMNQSSMMMSPGTQGNQPMMNQMKEYKNPILFPFFAVI